MLKKMTYNADLQMLHTLVSLLRFVTLQHAQEVSDYSNDLRPFGFVVFSATNCSVYTTREGHVIRIILVLKRCFKMKTLTWT